MIIFNQIDWYVYKQFKETLKSPMVLCVTPEQYRVINIWSRNWHIYVLFTNSLETCANGSASLTILYIIDCMLHIHFVVPLALHLLKKHTLNKTPCCKQSKKNVFVNKQCKNYLFNFLTNFSGYLSNLKYWKFLKT